MKAILAAGLLALAPAATFAHDHPAPAKPAKQEQVAKPDKTVKPVQAPQHSGGTDQYGCHTNHATGDYHCHNPM